MNMGIYAQSQCLLALQFYIEHLFKRKFPIALSQEKGRRNWWKQILHIELK